MNLIFNFPKDKTNLEDNVAYIKALLMQKYIENLNVSDIEKEKIKKYLIEELQRLE